MTLQLRAAKSGSSFAIYPSSVVQTGVKSLGCENRIAHPFPIHSWNLIFPCVVSAVKSGASSPKRNGMGHLQGVTLTRQTLTRILAPRSIVTIALQAEARSEPCIPLRRG